MSCVGGGWMETGLRGVTGTGGSRVGDGIAGGWFEGSEGFGARQRFAWCAKAGDWVRSPASLGWRKTDDATRRHKREVRAARARTGGAPAMTTASRMVGSYAKRYTTQQTFRFRQQYCILEFNCILECCISKKRKVTGRQPAMVD
jgi:hypothetical protein